MKKENNYWIDENDNRWDCNYYAEKQAEKCSNNCLNCRNCLNCTDCRNCRNCTDCRNCRNCTDCRNCIDCAGCVDCVDCTDCGNCIDCVGCVDCIDCAGCVDCIDCLNCRDCRDCRDWKNNPERIISKKIGSRNDQTTVYFDNKRTQVVCRCFNNTLEEFEKAVRNKYKYNSKDRKYFLQYTRFINKVKEYRS